MTLENTTTEEILDKHGSGYIMNKKKIDDIAKIIKQEKCKAVFYIRVCIAFGWFPMSFH
jgi:hypothetical protein